MESPSVPQGTDDWVILGHVTTHADEIVRSELRPIYNYKNQDDILIDCSSVYENVISPDYTYDNIRNLIRNNWFHFIGSNKTINDQKTAVSDYLRITGVGNGQVFIFYKIPLSFFIVKPFQYFVANYDLPIFTLLYKGGKYMGIPPKYYHGYSLFLAKKYKPFDFDKEDSRGLVALSPLSIEAKYIIDVVLKKSDKDAKERGLAMKEFLAKGANVRLYQ